MKGKCDDNQQQPLLIFVSPVIFVPLDYQRFAHTKCNHHTTYNYYYFEPYICKACALFFGWQMDKRPKCIRVARICRCDVKHSRQAVTIDMVSTNGTIMAQRIR